MRVVSLRWCPDSKLDGWPTACSLPCIVSASETEAVAGASIAKVTIPNSILMQFVWLPSIHFARHRVSLDRVISSDIGICDAITVLHVDFLTSHIEAPEEADGGASDSEAAPREATLSLTLATVALLPRCRHLKALHISFDSQFDDRNESASLIFLAARSMPARLLCLDVRVHCMSQRTALELHGRFLEAVDAHRATLRDISYTVTAINGPDESSGNVPCMSLAPLVAAPQLQCLLLELPMPFPEVEDLPKQTLKHLTISSPELSWLKGFCSTVGRFVTCLTLDGIEFSDPTVHPIGPSVTQIDLPHLRHLKESFTKNNFLPPINDTPCLAFPRALRRHISLQTYRDSADLRYHLARQARSTPHLRLCHRALGHATQLLRLPHAP